MTSPREHIYYKYLDYEGAEKTLEGRSLKFTHYSKLNDPFDAYFNDMYGFDIEEVRNNSKQLMQGALEENNPHKFSDISKLPLDDATNVCQQYQNFSPEMKQELHEKVAVEQKQRPDAVISQIILKQNIHAAKVMFETFGIFCATSDYNNPLMWAHYADQHRGVVIGLKPNIEKDSVLTQMRLVQYTNERPNLLNPSHQRENKSYDEFAKDAFQRILHTKSPEWEYEKEYRIAMPYAIKPGEKMWLLNLFPREISSLYLGCRLSAASEKGRRLISLAKQFNPDVKIFQARTAKRSYELEFEDI